MRESGNWKVCFCYSLNRGGSDAVLGSNWERYGFTDIVYGRGIFLMRTYPKNLRDNKANKQGTLVS